MPKARSLSSYLAELVIIFVGVALAFAVDNLREASNDRNVEGQYLRAFRQDLTADLQMLEEQQNDRQAQLRNARTALEFFEGRPNDPAIFFEAYWPVLWDLRTIPKCGLDSATCSHLVARFSSPRQIQYNRIGSHKNRKTGFRTPLALKPPETFPGSNPRNSMMKKPARTIAPRNAPPRSHLSARNIATA